MSDCPKPSAGKVNTLISFFDQKDEESGSHENWKVRRSSSFTEKYLAQFSNHNAQYKRDENINTEINQTAIEKNISHCTQTRKDSLEIEKSKFNIESQIQEESTFPQGNEDYQQTITNVESRDHQSIEGQFLIEETVFSNDHALEESSPDLTDLNYRDSSQERIHRDLETIIEAPLTGQEAKPIPTVITYESFNASDDARILQKALEEGSKKYYKLVEILTARTYIQRREISDLFYEIFGKSFTTTLKKELTGDFERTMVALVSNKLDFYAKELRKAIKGIGTNEDRLIELLCCHDSATIEEIKTSYKKLNKCSLLDDVCGDTSGRFKQILQNLINKNRKEPVDLSAQDVTNQLLKTVKDEDSSKDFISNVLVEYTRPFLFCVFFTYNQQTGKDFGNVIEEKFGGDSCKALMCIYKSVMNIHEYFATRLKASFAGLGTKEATLIEIAVSRSEIDLKTIVDEYNAVYPTPLYDMIKNETSGNFRLSMLALFGDHSVSDHYKLMDEAYLQNGNNYDSDTGLGSVDKGVKNNYSETKSEIEYKSTPCPKEYKDHLNQQIPEPEVFKHQEYHEIDTGTHQNVQLVEPIVSVQTLESSEIQISVQIGEMTDKACRSEDETLPDEGKEPPSYDQLDGQDAKYKPFPVIDITTVISHSSNQQNEVDLINELNKRTESQKECNDDSVLSDNSEQNVEKPTALSDFQRDNMDPQVEEDKNMASEYEITLPAHITGIECFPTILSIKGLNAAEDSTILSQALDGSKTKEAIIIDILTKRSYCQRKEIDVQFKNKNKDLEDVIKKELGGYCEETVLALMESPLSFITKELNKALKAFTVREEVVMEIICAADDNELKKIKIEYLELFGQQMTSAISKTLTGPLGDLIMELLTEERRDCKDVYSLYAYVADLHRNSNLSHDKIIDLMTSYRFDALFGLFYLFETLLETQFGDVIGEVCTGINKLALLIMYKSIMNRHAFHGEILHQAMRGYGTNEATLIRVIVGRCEIDLQNIKFEYEKMFGKELLQVVKSETSGSFRDALVSLINGNMQSKCNYEQQSSVIIYEDESPNEESHSSVLDDVIVPSQNQISDVIVPSQKQIGDVIEEDRSTKEDDLQIIISESNTDYKPPLLSSDDELTPTIHEALSFHPEEESKTLVDNLSDKSISSVLTTLTKVNGAQRQELLTCVKKNYGKNIIEELKPLLSDQCLKFIEYLTIPRYEVLAQELKQSMYGTERSLKTVAEIVITHGQEYIRYISNSYGKLFNISLLDDVKANTSGGFQEILIHLIKTPRITPTSNPVTLARQFAKMGDCGQAVSDGNSTSLNESYLINLMVTYSYQFLYDMFYTYSFFTNLEFTSVINKLSDGDVQMVLNEIYDWTYGRNYFTSKIQIDDESLTRILVTRCEIDLEKIKDQLDSSYGISLLEYCSNITDDYCKMVAFSVINGNKGYIFENHKSDEPNQNDQQQHAADVHFDDNSTNEIKAQEDFKCDRINDAPISDNSLEQADDEETLKKPTKNVKFFNNDNVPSYLKSNRISYVPKNDTPFDATEDATALKKALTGLVVDEKTIIDIFSKRNVSHRMQICIKYQELYGKALVTKLKKRLSGDFENLLVALITPIHAYLAKEVHQTVKGIGTDEKSLVEIICLQDEDSLKAICSGYKNLFDCSLQHAVANDTSGGAKQILGIILSEKRFDHNKDPYEIAQKFCHPDISLDDVVDLMSRHTYLFLFKVFKFFEKLNDNKFAELIKKLAKGDTKITLMTIHDVILIRQSFLAGRLHSALKSHNTKEWTVSRIIVSRRDIDLPDIKIKYEEIYKQSVIKDIKSATSGSYRKLLVALL